jgi:quinolinate synthase
MPDGRRTGTAATAYTVVMMRVQIPTNEPLAAGPLESYRKLDDATLASRIDEVRQRLGSRVLILGHHYQQDACDCSCRFAR